MKKTGLKHLILKTAFLLVLVSGKHRNETMPGLQSVQFRPVGKGSLVPVSRFQNPACKRRFPNCVSSDCSMLSSLNQCTRQFKEDRTLCLVWVLRCYLDHSQDLRGARLLLFIWCTVLGTQTGALSLIFQNVKKHLQIFSVSAVIS